MNRFKKEDSKGNKLPEAIGKGLNLDHLRKVEKARNLGSYIRFRISEKERIDFKLACEDIPGMTESAISRALHNAFANGQIKIK